MKRDFKYTCRVASIAFVAGMAIFLQPTVGMAAGTSPAEGGAATTKTEADSSAQRRDYEAGRALETFFNIFREVGLYYVDTVNPHTLIRNAADAMLSKLDPYTEYLSADKMDDFETMTTGKYAGIGALIRQRGEWVEISEPFAGTPSDRAGLRAGDRIVRIDGENMHSRGADYVRDKLRGRPGTKLAVTVRTLADSSVVRTAEITRERIQMPAVPYFGWVNDSVGYIRLDNFTENCGLEVRRALLGLRDDASRRLTGLVFDLRGNSGGILGEAVKIVGLFVPRGTNVVSMRGRVSSANIVYNTTAEPVVPDLPLAVLINRGSASASEITAGALQDLDRAVIVGQRSFGKGLVQSSRLVGQNEMIKMTMAKYYIPTGRSIQAVDYSHRNEDGSVGLVPDSLIRAYKTIGGRTVYDGGGIMPDVKCTPEYFGKFTAILIALGYLDDYANLYAAHHPAPADRNAFRVDDAIYGQFTAFMADKPIDFESMTERKLRELREMARQEKYADRIAGELDTIAQKIKDDKQAELRAFAPEIKEALGSLIITRWAYNAGRIEYELRGDKEVRRAVEVLSDLPEYQRIVTTQDTDRK